MHEQVVDKLSLALSITFAIFSYINDRTYIATVLFALAAISASVIAIKQVGKDGLSSEKTMRFALLARAYNLMAYFVCVILLFTGKSYIFAAIFWTLGTIGAIVSALVVLVNNGKARASEQPGWVTKVG